MVQPPRKHSIEERATYLNDPARLEKEASLVDQNQQQLKRETISWFEETKRKRTDNDDELSVVSATKRPKEHEGLNNFERSSHWNTPTHQRERRRPTAVHVPENNVGSPVSTIDSPLVAIRRTLVADDYVGTRITFKCSGIVFYGTVKRCFVGDSQAKNWEIVYDNKDEEEILVDEFRKQQKLYAKERMYDPKGNPNQPAIQRPQPLPPKPPSITKKDNIKKRKTVQKQTKKKKTKKTDKTALPTSKLHDTDGDTVVTHGNYTLQRPYSYEVQYNNGS